MANVGNVFIKRFFKFFFHVFYVFNAFYFYLNVYYIYDVNSVKTQIFVIKKKQKRNC